MSFIVCFMEQFLRGTGNTEKKALENYWTVWRNKGRLSFAVLYTGGGR